MKNQKGFGAVEGLLILVIVGILGFVGWYVWHSKNNANQIYKNMTNSESVAQTSKASFIFIPQWHIKIPLDNLLQGVKVSSPKASSYDLKDSDVTIITPQLDKSWKCAVDPPENIKGSIGSISRTESAKRVGPYEPSATTKIDKYTYGLEPISNPASCTTDTDLFNQLTHDFQSQFAKAESY
jgi:hypothetical protein